MNEVLGTLLFALSISPSAAAAVPQWTKLRDPSGGSVLSISASAARPGQLLLGAHEGGAWHSTDDGRSWELRTDWPSRFFDLSLDPIDPLRALAVEEGFFMKSFDAGVHWTHFDFDLQKAELDLAVAHDPSVPGRAYAVAQGYFLDGGYLFRSNDHGATFALFQSGLPPGGMVDVEFDPHSPGRVWAATERAVAWYLETIGGDLFAFDFGCPVPQSYCEAEQNSAGLFATVSGVGEASVSGGGFSIGVDSAIPFQPPVGFFSRIGRDSEPFLGGVLCVRGPLLRLGTTELDRTGCGELEVPLDASLVGTKQWFQAIYRDPSVSDGTGVGLTDALEVLFCR